MTRNPQHRAFSSAIMADLAKSGLTGDNAQQMGWRMDLKGNLVIPYNNGTGFERTRLTTPRQTTRNGKTTTQRYVQPRGTKPELFLPSLSNMDWDDIKRESGVPLIITEGEKKAASACKVGFPCIGLGGVDCFASKGGVPLRQWDEFELNNRLMKIVFDSDIVDKTQVQGAARRLAFMLMSQGAMVVQVMLGTRTGGAGQ